MRIIAASELVSVVQEPAAKASRLDGRGAQRHATSWSCSCSATPTLNQAVLVARLDNLGKGAAGAAVQNIKLMLGLDDAAAQPASAKARQPA